MFEKVRIQSIAESENARAWSRALEAGPEHLRLIKSEATSRRVSAVYRATLLGSQVALKLDAPLGVRAIAGLLGLDRSRAARQWGGARVLRAAGIEAAEPFALARCRWTHEGITRRADLVAIEWLDGRTLLETLVHAKGRDRSRIGEQAGVLTATLTRAMILNRDHKPSNIVVLTPEGNREPKLSMIDTVGIRKGVLPDRASRRMLRDLMLEPTGVGRAPGARDITAFLRGLDRAGFWSTRDPNVRRTMKRALIADVRRAIEEHGDPTPKVSPLDD